MGKLLPFLGFILISSFAFAQDTLLLKRIKVKEAEAAFYSKGGRNFKTIIGGYASIMSSPEQQCNSALPVCQLTYNQPNSYSGEGSSQEIPSNSSCLGSNEKNSVWYIFTVTAAGTLDFDITPTSMSDDYDFALYNITGSNCSGISSGAITPIRCNFSATSGITGLDPSASNTSEPASGPNTSTTLPVTVGQTYVLVISNYSSTQNGYTLDFTPSSASIFDVTPPTPQTVTAPCGTSTITLNTSESVTCASISSGGTEFTISGTGGPYTVTSAVGVNCGSATPQISITVSPALSGGGPWTLNIATGGDGNTLIDNCGNVMLPTSINFNQTPTTATITGDNSMCTGETIGLTASNGSSWSWSGPNINGSSTSQTISVTPTSNATYNVTVNNGSCGSSTASFSITVSQSPTAAFTVSPTTICAGNAVSFTNTTQLPPTCGGLGLSQCTGIGSSCGFFQTCQATGTFSTGALPTYLWTFGDGGTDFYLAGSGTENPTHTYNTPGTYTVTLNASSLVGSCSNTVSQTINVLPGSAPVVASNDTTICTGSANLTASGGSSYTWSTGGSTIGTTQSISVSPITTTTYTVTSPGCSGNSTDYVTVNVSSSNITINTNNATICPGDSVSLIASGASSYSWSPSTGLNSTTGNTVIASPNISTSYTVTGNPGSCSSIQIVNITVNNTLTVTASPTTSTICNGENTTFTALGATSYTWSPGTNLSSTSGSSVVANPSVNTQYTVTGNTGNCSDTAIVSIIVNNSPVVSVTPASSTICPNEPVNINASGGTSYSWFPATGLNTNTGSSVTATVNSATIYTVIGFDNNCSDTAFANINLNTPITLSVSPTNAAVCPGESVLLTATGATTYSWFPPVDLDNSNTSSVTSSPTNTITYTIIGASGLCTDTTTITVNVVNSLNIQVTPSTDSVCAGASTTLMASGASSFSWFPSTGISSTTTPSVTAAPLNTTQYTVIGTSGGCSDTTTVEITVLNLPQVQVNPTQTFICPGSTTNLFASGATSYTWSPVSGLDNSNLPGANATPAATTFYTVTGTKNGCSDTAIAEVVVTNNLTISVSPATATICPGGSASITANGAATYSWFPSATLNSSASSTVVSSPTNTTTYTVIGLTGTCADTAFATITVSNNITITASASPDSVCFGETSVINLNGATNYTWTPQTGTTVLNASSFATNPSTSTIYTIIGSSGTCSDTVLQNVFIKTSPVITVNPANITICPGSSILLNASGANTYSWFPSTGLSGTNGNNIAASPSQTTIYTVYGESNGCADTTTSTINVTVIPNLTVGASNSIICEGESTNLTASGFTTYNWFPAVDSYNNDSSQVIVSPNNSTTYTVSGSIGGCSVSKSILITVNPVPAINISAPTDSLCYGDTATLTASGATNYFWYPLNMFNANTGSTVQAHPLSSILFTCVGMQQGCSDTVTVKVNVKNPVVITALPDTAVCPGGSVTLTASGGTSYSWSNTQTTNQITVSPINETYYYVYGYNGSCSNVDSALVDLLPLPRANFEFANNPVSSYNQSAVIVDLSTGANSYIYLSGDTINDSLYIAPNPTIQYYTENGDTFAVKQIVYNEFGCMDSVEREFIIKPDFGIYIPNAFTPDGLGFNEKFGAKGFGIIEYSLFIYDRWGNLLFKTNDINVGWDGKVGNKLQGHDIYVWKIIYKPIDGRERTMDGQFSLIR